MTVNKFRKVEFFMRKNKLMAAVVAATLALTMTF
jgi:hypothetical protein